MTSSRMTFKVSKGDGPTGPAVVVNQGRGVWSARADAGGTTSEIQALTATRMPQGRPACQAIEDKREPAELTACRRFVHAQGDVPAATQLPRGLAKRPDSLVSPLAPGLRQLSRAADRCVTGINPSACEIWDR